MKAIGPERSFHDAVGGDPFFVALVDRFYAAVETDARLRPLYPEDLSGPKHWLSEFLIQYWGGPARYDEAKGHPRLRQRHAPFAIGPEQAEAWLEHMTAAVAAAHLPPALEQPLQDYFARAAPSLINQPG